MIRAMIPVIGLTGSAASGKTFIAEYIKERHSLPVFCADAATRQLLRDPATLAELQEIFPDVFEDDVLHKPKLAARVFAREEDLETLESLLHPRIAELRHGWMEGLAVQSPRARAAVWDVPLLFETGMEKQCTYVMVAMVDEDVRQQRLAAREGYTPERRAAMDRRQWPQAEKTARADAVINTGGSEDETRAQVDKALQAWGIVGGIRDIESPLP